MVIVAGGISSEVCVSTGRAVEVSVHEVEVVSASVELESVEVGEDSALESVDELEGDEASPVAVTKDVPMTWIGGTAPDEKAGAGAAFAGGVSGAPEAGMLDVPMTLIGGGAPLELLAAGADADELLEGLTTALTGAGTPVAGVTPVPTTLIWRLPNDLTLALPSAGVALDGRQSVFSECSTVKTVDTVRRVNPAEPSICAEAKNWVPPGKGSSITALWPPEGTETRYGSGATRDGSVSRGINSKSTSLRDISTVGKSISDHVMCKDSHWRGTENTGEKA